MVDLRKATIGKYYSAVAIVLSAIFSTSAQATCPTYHTLTNGTTADASQVMDNFNSILQCPNFIQNTNGNAVASMLNSNGGAAATSEFLLNNGTANGQMVFFGSGYTTSGVDRQNGLEIYANGAGGITLDTGAAQPIFFGINNAEKMRLDANGNLGIGTTSPTYIFDVNAGTGANMGQFSSTTTNSTAGAGIRISSSGTTEGWLGTGGFGVTFSSPTLSDFGIGSRARLGLQAGNGATIILNTDISLTGSGGTCTISGGAGATSCGSDARLKKNVSSISGADALAKLSLVHGVTYNNGDPSRDQSQQVGLIAQDVLAAFPQVVGKTTIVFNGVPGTYYTLNYAALVSPLISAVNELNVRVGELRNENNSLKKQVTELKAKIRTDDDRLSALEAKAGIRTAANDNVLTRVANLFPLNVMKHRAASYEGKITFK